MDVKSCIVLPFVPDVLDCFSKEKKKIFCQSLEYTSDCWSVVLALAFERLND